MLWERPCLVLATSVWCWTWRFWLLFPWSSCSSVLSCLRGLRFKLGLQNPQLTTEHNKQNNKAWRQQHYNKETKTNIGDKRRKHESQNNHKTSKKATNAKQQTSLSLSLTRYTNSTAVFVRHISALILCVALNLLVGLTVCVLGKKAICIVRVSKCLTDWLF